MKLIIARQIFIGKLSSLGLRLQALSRVLKSAETAIKTNQPYFYLHGYFPFKGELFMIMKPSQ